MSLSVRAAAGARGDADGAAVSARKTVDFEGLSFAAGSHLNTNKNINLPPGSTRTTDKVRCCFIPFRAVTCVSSGFRLLLHETGQMSSICSFAADNAQVIITTINLHTYMLFPTGLGGDPGACVEEEAIRQ